MEIDEFIEKVLLLKEEGYTDIVQDELELLFQGDGLKQKIVCLEIY